MNLEFDPAALASSLLSEHRPHLAKAIAHQMCELVPRYRTVPEMDLERSVGSVLRGVDRLLRGDGKAKVLVAIDETFDSRAAEGFSPGELLLATHSYLPVLRRVFCERAGDLREGLRAYEEVEALVLPLLQHVIELAFEARGATDPGFTKRPRASSASEPPSMPALAESDDDEATFS